MRLFFIFIPVLVMAQQYIIQFYNMNSLEKNKYHNKLWEDNISLPDTLDNELKMNIVLYKYDKDKIDNFLEKKIPLYQKIEANYKLKRYREAENEIFSSSDINSFLYKDYLEIFKHTADFISFDTEIQKDFLTTNLNIKENPVLLKLKTINDNYKEISISKKIFNYNFSIGYQSSDSSSPVIKISKNTRCFSYYLNYHQNIVNLNKVSKNTYIIKQDMLGLKSKYSFKNEDIIIFKSEFSKNYYNNTYFQTLFELFGKYQLNNLITILSYIDNVYYSRIYKNYSEMGFSIKVWEKETYSKKFKFFIAPLIYYNTQSKFGYKIKTGFNKRVIKADNLSFVISIGSYDKEIKIAYIYYF